MSPLSKKDKKEEKPTMSQSFFRACGLILLGIIALWIALELLVQFWGWLVLLSAIGASILIVISVVRARRDRW